jgi:hypothetical protein
MRKSTSSHGKEDHFRCRRSSRSGESDRRASILYLIICRVSLGDTALRGNRWRAYRVPL